MTDPLVAITDGLHDAFEEGYKQGKADAMTWIAVSERLPEKEDEAVIVWEKQGFALIDWRHDNKWAILDNNCGIATHWMSLPEPPIKPIAQEEVDG